MREGISLLESGWSPEIKELAEYTAFSVDVLPEVHAKRRAVEIESYLILEARRQEVSDGGFSKIWPSVNPMTAAERVYQAETDEEADIAVSNLHMNSLRVFTEAYDRFEASYFQPISQTFRPGIGYEAGGNALIDTCTNALSPDDHEEEQHRRVKERVQASTYDAFHDSPLKKSHWLLTFKPCPDYAKAGQTSSYVPENQKMMVEGAHFMSDGHPDSLDIEALGIPGTIITPALINLWLKARGVIDDSDNLNKTELTGFQIAIKKSDFSGVIDVIRDLDTLAGSDVQFGQSALFYENYYSIIHRADTIKEILEPYACRLDEYALDLKSQEKDDAWAGFMYERFVNELLHEIARDDPARAAIMFDSRTARGYEAAIVLDRQGQYSQADAARISVQEQAPAAAYCGAGSCGLRPATTLETAHARSLGLSGDILAFAQGKCPKGHSVTLFNMEGSRACSKCQMNELKRAKVPPKKLKSKSKKPSKTSWFLFN